MRPGRRRGGTAACTGLRPGDLGPLAVLGLRSAPLRAILSAAGIAVGIATLVAVLGMSTASRAQLVAQIDALGTNLLTVTPGQSSGGQTQDLPDTAPAMVGRIGPVKSASAIGDTGANIYRNDRIPTVNTDALSVYAVRSGLLSTLQGHVHEGRFLNPATERLPAVVLGADAARALGVDRADGSIQLWIGTHYFDVVGILDPLSLAPELDRSALIGFPITQRLLHAAAHPVEIYVRTDPSAVAAVQTVLASTTDPAAPQDVAINNPADALTARADAAAALNSLYLALGAIALLVGGIGIANVMIIAVLERRVEIGLRRALGATPANIAAQFMAEATVLSLLGGATGTLLGAAATTGFAAIRNWPATTPLQAIGAAAAIAVTVGATAGLYPAIKAARLAPAEALRTI